MSIHEYKNRYPIAIEKDMENIYRRAVQRVISYTLNKLRPQLNKKVGMDALDDPVPPIDNIDFVSVIHEIKTRHPYIYGKTVIVGPYTISARDYADVQRVIRSLKNFTEKAFDQSSKDLEDRIKKGSGQHYARNMRREDIGKKLTLNITDDPAVKNIINESARRSVQLISTASQQAIDAVEVTVRNAVMNGWTQKALTKELQDKTGVVESRAAFWGRDQTSKITGDINESLQTSAGFPGYIWMTQLDGRVRDSHSELHGQYFTWQSGSDEGNPGDPPNCRCYAQPANLDADALSGNEIEADIGKIDRMKKEMDE